jgi:tetratricopeptide (TPR) repeat protein
VDDYNQALRLSPQDPILYILHGRAEEEVGNNTIARSDFNRAGSVSTDPELTAQAADALGSLTFYGDGLSLAEQGIARFPKHWELHRARAHLEAAIGDDSAALGEFQLAVRLAPASKLADVLGDRADFYRLRLDYALAIADYTQAIGLTRSNHTLFAGRAYARMAIGQWREALKDLTTAIEIYTDLHSSSTWPLARLYEDRGKASVEIGDSPAAARDFREALLIIGTSGPADWKSRLADELGSSGS